MTRNKTLVDSSFIIALFKNFDTNHEKAKIIATEILSSANELYVTDMIISESLTIISQRIGKETSLKLQEFLLNRGIFQIIYTTETILYGAGEIFAEVKSKNMSFTDCVSLTAVKYHGLKSFVTFDKKDFTKFEWKFRFKLISDITT